MAAASSSQWPLERRYRCRCGRARIRPAAPGRPAARAPPAARAAPWGRRQRRARSAPQAALREAACRSQGKWATDAAAPAGSARRGGAGKQQVRPPSLPPVGRRMVWLCTLDLYVKNTAMHNVCDRAITMPVIEQCCSTHVYTRCLQASRETSALLSCWQPAAASCAVLCARCSSMCCASLQLQIIGTREWRRG